MCSGSTDYRGCRLSVLGSPILTASSILPVPPPPSPALHPPSRLQDFRGCVIHYKIHAIDFYPVSECLAVKVSLIPRLSAPEETETCELLFVVTCIYGSLPEYWTGFHVVAFPLQYPRCSFLSSVKILGCEMFARSKISQNRRDRE